MSIVIKNDIKYGEKKRGIVKVAQAFIDWNKMPIGSYFECQSKEEFQKLRSNASTFGVRLSMRFADETYKKCYAFRIPYDSTDNPVHDVFGDVNTTVIIEKIAEKQKKHTEEVPNEQINQEYHYSGLTQHDHDLDLHNGGNGAFVNMPLEQRHTFVLTMMNTFVFVSEEIDYHTVRKACNIYQITTKDEFAEVFKDSIKGER